MHDYSFKLYKKYTKHKREGPSYIQVRVAVSAWGVLLLQGKCTGAIVNHHVLDGSSACFNVLIAFLSDFSMRGFGHLLNSISDPTLKYTFSTTPHARIQINVINSPKIAKPAVNKLIICNYLSEQIY